MKAQRLTNFIIERIDFALDTSGTVLTMVMVPVFNATLHRIPSLGR